MRRIAQGACWLITACAFAQESRIGAEFRREGEALTSGCSKFSFGAIGSCATVLFTGQPLHIAAGSLAPQNGFGLGPALVTHWTPNELWRLKFDVDAVGTTSGSWRAGAYMTAILTRHRPIRVGSGAPAPVSTAMRQYPVFHVYSQSTSLGQIGFFGVGPNTSDTQRQWFGMRETIAGANVVWPIYPKLQLSLFGEMNGRFVDLRSAPLGPGSSFAQFGQGIRARPTLFSDVLRLNYALTYKEYLASQSNSSFQRFTVDLQHTFPLYHRTRTYLPREFNPPDDCSLDPQTHRCPGITRDLEGSFGLRLYISQSMTAAGNFVPFYFQPTLGGTDIDGNTWLPSYQDYRFRAPNLIVARASFEHSIWGPLGFTFLVDEGKVAVRRGDLDFHHLRHSYGAGLTLRAGGFPLISLLYAWGGGEGTHVTANVNSSLLGGSPRPALQ